MYGFASDEMFEARLVLEVGVAGLAAEHASAEHLAAMASYLHEVAAAVRHSAAEGLDEVQIGRLPLPAGSEGWAGARRFADGVRGLSARRSG